MSDLTLQEVQKISKKRVNEKGFKWSAYAEYYHLVEEVGELGESLTFEQGEREAGSGELGNQTIPIWKKRLAMSFFRQL